MRKNNFRMIIALVISSMLIGCWMPAMAEEAPEAEPAETEPTETDTVAESKSIDDMTIDELKIAYLELQLENEKLKNELNSLQQEKTEAETEAIVEEPEIEAEGEQVLVSVDDFENDIVASYNARGVISDKYTTAEINTMTNDEHVSYYYECAEAERDFYNKYKNATFEDLNILYLCGQYIDGLSKQYQACENYFENNDYNTWYEYWQSGYYNRAYVIVELSDYYELPFGDVSEMRADTESMDSLNEAETRNAAVDSATVQHVQQLLNDIGFYCGNADGVSGKRTVKSIKRFQEMYGYDPIDGMIDDELVAQLEAEVAKKTPATEAEAPTTEENEED